MRNLRLKLYHVNPILSWKTSIKQWPLLLLPGPPTWWTHNYPKLPLSKEKYRFVMLPLSKLVCYISPRNGSIFKGLQQAITIIIILLLSSSSSSSSSYCKYFINRTIYIFAYRKCYAHDFNGNVLLTECRDFARKCYGTNNSPFTQRTDFQWKKLPQNLKILSLNFQ